MQSLTTVGQRTGHFADKSLIVLFSHSARIRCFLKMMYPYVSGGNTYSMPSIYEILGDKKFFNCVSFKLASAGPGNIFLLTMIHEGHEIKDGKRLNKVQFYDKIREITKKDEGTGIKVYTKPQENNTGREPMDDGYALNMLLSEGKDIIIIRHGQSTHNEKKFLGREHLTRDTSLTKNGFKETVKIAKDLVINNHFKNYINIVFYVSELFRTQQTAMIFVNILSRNNPTPNSIVSSPENPVILRVIPCNHEFDENKIEEDWCFKTIEETSHWYKRENKRTSDRIKKRRYVKLDIYDYITLGGSEGAGTGDTPAKEPKKYSYFYVYDDDYDENKPCTKSVFHYIQANIWRSPTLYSVPTYTDFEVASRYNYTYGHYTDGIVGTIRSGLNRFISRGGSLKRKRRTIRRKSKRFTKKRNKRKSKRFTKKRNSRRTNKKKRLTNKRRTNKKKRFTKRR